MRIFILKFIVLCLFILVIFTSVSSAHSSQKAAQNKMPVKFINYVFAGRINPLVESINNSASVSYSDYNLSYGEYNEGSPYSKYLDTEDGSLPDFGLNFSFTFLHFADKIHYDYANGTTSYTERNPPVGTDNDIIYNISDRLGYMLALTHNFVVTPYIKVSKYIWNRVILPSYPLVSYREKYRTYYWQSGLIAEYAVTRNFLLKISGGIGYAFDSHMTAYFNTPVHFNLGNKMVYGFKLDNYYLLMKHIYLRFGIAYRRIKFGHSPLYNGFIYEPSSVTNTFLYTAGIGYAF